MKKINVIFNKKYFLDGLLIMFSVLFALFINKTAENLKLSGDKKVAMENIVKELQQNTLLLEEWITLHVEVRDRIESVISGKDDSLKSKLLKYDHLNIGLLTDGKSLVSAVFSKTAWETAKSTGIISEFDFVTAQRLSGVYMLQDFIFEKTIVRTTDFLFDAQTHNLDRLIPTLIQLHLSFVELTGQEYLLDQLYQETLAYLEK
jgi:hypothetical protein